MNEADTLVFTIAVGGYDRAFGRILSTQRRYADEHGYDYICFARDHDPRLNREVAWLKVPLLLGAMSSGYKYVMFIDCDVQVNDECPPLKSIVLENPSCDIFMANGHSGRLNSGVIICRTSPFSVERISMIFSSAGEPLPPRMSVGWGENGYFIKYLDEYRGLHKLGVEYNNSVSTEIPSFLVHYTGPLRAKYPFSDEEQAAWTEIGARLKPAGEGELGDRVSFYQATKALYNDVTRSWPRFPSFQGHWVTQQHQRRRRAINPTMSGESVHFCVDINFDDPDNPYCAELIKGFQDSEPLVRVLHGVDRFWTDDYSGVRALFIQWPEVLCGWKVPDRALLDKISTRLSEISVTTEIFLTVHNIHLKADFGDAAVELLNIVGSVCSGFIHLSHSSIDAFKKHYADYWWCRTGRHCVIPHGDYDVYFRSEVAETKLKQNLSAPYVLIFGGIRSKAELEVVDGVCSQLERDGRPTIVAGPVADHLIGWKERKRLEQVTESLVVRRMHRRLPSSEIKELVSGARVVFLPRDYRLNSGVLFLAYTFLKPVVAPDILSIGENQRAIDGYLYPMGDVGAAIQVLNRAWDSTVGERLALMQRTLQFKSTMMNWGVIGKMHSDLVFGDGITKSVS